MALSEFCFGFCNGWKLVKKYPVFFPQEKLKTQYGTEPRNNMDIHPKCPSEPTPNATHTMCTLLTWLGPIDFKTPLSTSVQHHLFLRTSRSFALPPFSAKLLR